MFFSFFSLPSLLTRKAYDHEVVPMKLRIHSELQGTAPKPSKHETMVVECLPRGQGTTAEPRGNLYPIYYKTLSQNYFYVLQRALNHVLMV